MLSNQSIVGSREVEFIEKRFNNDPTFDPWGVNDVENPYIPEVKEEIIDQMYDNFELGGDDDDVDWFDDYDNEEV